MVRAKGTYPTCAEPKNGAVSTGSRRHPVKAVMNVRVALGQRFRRKSALTGGKVFCGYGFIAARPFAVSR